MTVNYFIENVIRPILKTGLNNYMRDRLENPIVSSYHNHVSLFTLDFLTYEPFKERTQVSFYFLDKDDKSVNSEDDVLHTILFKDFSLSEPFLKVSNKTEEELEVFEDFYCIRVHDNNIKKISDKEHIECFSEFFLKSLGLFEDYKNYIIEKMEKIEGEVVF